MMLSGCSSEPAGMLLISMIRLRNTPEGILVAIRWQYQIELAWRQVSGARNGPVSHAEFRSQSSSWFEQIKGDVPQVITCLCCTENLCGK